MLESKKVLLLCFRLKCFSLKGYMEETLDICVADVWIKPAVFELADLSFRVMRPNRLTLGNELEKKETFTKKILFTWQNVTKTLFVFVHTNATNK